MTMIRLSRALLVILTVFVGAIYLPQAYWLAFDVNIRAPRILYSPVLDTLLFVRSTGKEVQYTDARGKEYTREEFERLTPLANYRQLAATGAMPESLRGVRLELKEVGLNNLSLRIPEEAMDVPPIDLFPLFESQSGRVRLEMPKEMFRITSAMEFLTARTNAIDTGLTRRFTGALISAGFAFPATEIAGNPTTMKQFDEGYFVADANGKVFHIKMVRGEPFCRDIGLPDSITVRKMIIVETPLREFYGMLVDRAGSVHLISYDRYRLIPLPLTGYEPGAMTLLVSGDLFFRTITAVGATGIRTVVTDRDYRVVCRHEESWPDRHGRTPGTIAGVLFPFTLNLTDPGSLFVRPFFRWAGPEALAGIALSLALLAVILQLRKKPLAPRWFDFAVVACTGVFGLLATTLIDSIQEKGPSA
jgi:hypothetical protein